jgi:putative endonuclease
MLSPSPWWVYILYSVSTGRLYTGIAKDPQIRLAKHNAGKGAKYTRYGRPWVIVYKEQMNTHGDALRREIAIKKLPRQKKLILAGIAA